MRWSLQSSTLSRRLYGNKIDGRDVVEGQLFTLFSLMMISEHTVQRYSGESVNLIPGQITHITPVYRVSIKVSDAS